MHTENPRQEKKKSLYYFSKKKKIDNLMITINVAETM